MRQMGGLGKQMPFVRNGFVIGAAGPGRMPILNGFWSKELVLEAGLERRAAVDLRADAGCGAGLTALYTFPAAYWMVFSGEAAAAFARSRC